ncbi:MAG: hypothetical protein AAF657_18400 [Acidobacteriota bacterium]
MKSQADNRECRECGETGVTCELGAAGPEPTGDVLFSHSCGCTMSRTISTTYLDPMAFACSLCGYDYALLLASRSPDTKMRGVTRFVITILGFIFLWMGSPLLTSPRPGPLGTMVFATALILSILTFYWAISGKITNVFFKRLVEMSPLLGPMGCAVKIASGVMLCALLAYWGAREVLSILSH